MTTLCLCDWVEPGSGRESLRVRIDAAAPPPDGAFAPSTLPEAVFAGVGAGEDDIDTRLKKEHAT